MSTEVIGMSEKLYEQGVFDILVADQHAAGKNWAYSATCIYLALDFLAHGLKDPHPVFGRLWSLRTGSANKNLLVSADLVLKSMRALEDPDARKGRDSDPVRGLGVFWPRGKSLSDRASEWMRLAGNSLVAQGALVEPGLDKAKTIALMNEAIGRIGAMPDAARRSPWPEYLPPDLEITQQTCLVLYSFLNVDWTWPSQYKASKMFFPFTSRGAAQSAVVKGVRLCDVDGAFSEPPGGGPKAVSIPINEGRHVLCLTEDGYEPGETKNMLNTAPFCVAFPAFFCESLLGKQQMSIGIETLFDEARAPLDDLFLGQDERGWVSSFVHKCSVAIDEQGIQAKAETVVLVSMRSLFIDGPAPPTQKVLMFNKPFFVSIKDLSGVELFAASVSRPGL